MRYIRIPALTGAILLLLPPVVAHGQVGKRPDPNSPAGVEYQLPLEQARTNAIGSRDGPGSGRGDRNGVAPLFGAGIVALKAADRAAVEPPGGENSQGRAARDAVGGGAGRSEVGGDGRHSGDPPEGPGALKQSALSSDGGSAPLQIAGMAVAVLLLGAVMGIFLRRGLRPSEE